MPKGVSKMREFLADCLEHYSLIFVMFFWIPMMLITIPIAVCAVCMTTSYQVVASFFGTVDDE